jgi:hypothetical protein
VPSAFSLLWSLLRIFLAAFLVWVMTVDGAARLGRMALMELPDFEYAAEVAALRAQGRFGEAIMVAEAGLTHVEGPRREAILKEKALVEEAQGSWLRRVKDVGLGAMTGGGDTLEAIGGAVAADFFVVGDIRDLVIQGSNATMGEETDPVIIALSAVGLVTTLAPQVDWVPSFLKTARRASMLTDRLADAFVGLAKGRQWDRMQGALADVAKISEKASPGGAMRLMKHADDPDDIARIARFTERHPTGAFALHMTGERGMEALRASKTAGKVGVNASGAIGEITSAERTIIAAAKKGPAGARLLSTPMGRAMLRPHPLVGILKTFYRGNAEGLVTGLLDRLGPSAWWLLPAAWAWLVVEIALLGRRVMGWGRGGKGERLSSAPRRGA